MDVGGNAQPIQVNEKQ